MRKYILAALLALLTQVAYADNPVVPFLTNQSTGDTEWKGDASGNGFVRTKIDTVDVNGIGTTNTYTANQVVGGPQTVAAPDQSAFMQSVTVNMNTNNLCPCDLRLFNQALTTSTVTDHTSIAITAADATKVSGIIHIQDCSLDGIWTCQSQNQMVPFKSSATAAPYNIIVVLVARNGASITAADVNMRLRFVR